MSTHYDKKLKQAWSEFKKTLSKKDLDSIPKELYGEVYRDPITNKKQRVKVLNNISDRNFKPLFDNYHTGDEKKFEEKYGKVLDDISYEVVIRKIYRDESWEKIARKMNFAGGGLNVKKVFDKAISALRRYHEVKKTP